MSIRYISSAGRGLLPLAAALVVAVSAPAAAQEPTAMQKFFGAIGLLELPKDPIDYRERAPLVVPPSSGLIAPRNPDDIRAVNPDWPVDHVSRRDTLDPKAQQRADEIFYTGERLGAIELQRGRISREEAARRDPASREAAANLGEQDRIGPIGLGFRGWNNKKEERVVFSGEPARTRLTEPPSGLRTPSLDAPYGVVSSRPDPNKRQTFDRSASENDPNRGGR